MQPQHHRLAIPVPVPVPVPAPSIAPQPSFSIPSFKPPAAPSLAFAPPQPHVQIPQRLSPSLPSTPAVPKPASIPPVPLVPQLSMSMLSGIHNSTTTVTSRAPGPISVPAVVPVPQPQLQSVALPVPQRAPAAASLSLASLSAAQPPFVPSVPLASAAPQPAPIVSVTPPPATIPVPQLARPAASGTTSWPTAPSPANFVVPAAVSAVKPAIKTVRFALPEETHPTTPPVLVFAPPPPPVVPPLTSISPLGSFHAPKIVFPSPVPADLSPPLPQLTAEELMEPTAVEELLSGASPPPDFRKWIFPLICDGESQLSNGPEKTPFATLKVPNVSISPSVVTLNAMEILQQLPVPLPPEFVIFGGAKYSGIPLDMPRPPPLTSDDELRKAQRSEASELQRLQFLVDQLDIAKRYLKMEVKRVSQFDTFGVAQGRGGGSGGLEGKGMTASPLATVEEGDEDISKSNIYTVAYFGTPQQLMAVVEKMKHRDALNSAGYVAYRRRRWGLKRQGETYALGLGMKGTPLQFAAVAGKLDNTILLLLQGATDTSSPLLKDILSPESARLVRSIYKPRVKRTPAVEAAVADEVSQTLDTEPHHPSQSFVSEQQYHMIDPGVVQA